MVYLFLADGFEIIEALAPVDMLRRAKIDVKTVGVDRCTLSEKDDFFSYRRDKTTGRMASFIWLI